MTAQLKPCPFCGGKAELWMAHGDRTAWIACMSKCSVLVSKEYKTDAEAIAAWNTRADAPELVTMVATMREMHEGWSNALELGLIPERHRVSAQILRDDAAAALAAWEAITASKEGEQ